MDYEAYIDAVAAGTDRMAAAVRDLDPDTPVPTCPDWTVRDLVSHMGQVQRWAAAHVEQRAERLAKRLPTDDRPDDDLASWLNEGGVHLVQVLRATPADTPMGVFGAAGDARFWARRQAHEMALHAIDAQAAAGEIEPMDAILASDGIDELLTAMVPLGERRNPLGLPGSLHVHCTDVDGEWTMRTVDGRYTCERTHTKGDAALRGPASTVLCVLTNRLPVEAPAEVFGDAGLVDWWRAHFRL